jgi:hypothetical protein
MLERRRHLRPGERVAALLAAAMALALNVAATVQLFAPPTTFGYHLIYTDGHRVKTVDQRSPAGRAGILPGDQLDFTKSTLHDRIVGLEYQPARIGESVRFTLERDSERREVTLHAVPFPSTSPGREQFSLVTSFLRITGFAYIVVALAILLRRPSRMTWGLFLYLCSATNVTLYRFPESLFPYTQLATDILDIAGPIGLVVFAARFPNDWPTGWRAWLDRLAIPVGAIFAVPNLAWDATSLFYGAAPSRWMSLGSTWGALALFAVAGATLAATYFGTPAWQRQRLQWVIAGIILTLFSSAASWARYWETTYSLTTSDWLIWIVMLLYTCAPFAIAYGVVRQRVFDFSFVVSRTLVYTIVSGAIFTFFALVEWIAGRILEHAGIAIFLVALAAIVVAFSLDALYSNAERFVESTLFRRRHLAERHLARIASGLGAAENASAVEDALVREPLQAYGLSSAELYQRVTSSEFRRDGKALASAVALQLAGERRPVRLHEADAVLAVPVFALARLEAIVLYGAHAGGEDIDPDEAISLEALAKAAGTAYDHLETLRAERDAARWQRVAERQSRELAALRERCASLRPTER